LETEYQTSQLISQTSLSGSCWLGNLKLSLNKLLSINYQWIN